MDFVKGSPADGPPPAQEGANEIEQLLKFLTVDLVSGEYSAHIAVMLGVSLVACIAGLYAVSSLESVAAKGPPPLGEGQVTVGKHWLEDDEVKGAIFDCDGTLVDSMGAWLPSWEAAAKEFGLTISEEQFW